MAGAVLALIPPAAAGPLALGGLLPLGEPLSARWTWSGAWTWPVGDPRVLCRPGIDGEPEWKLLRGFQARSEPERHQGADLGDGRARDPVRAAAHGLVLLARDGEGAFGTVVVLAHRLREGGIAYTVYSHLAHGSARVRPGDRVESGDVIAAIGRTGNATTDHLHFEVRVAVDPALRWERARAVDPVAFVRGRLPRFAGDTTRAALALDWADRAGLLPGGCRPDDPLTRETWQWMLSRAARVPVLEPPHGGAALRAWLIDEGVLPEGEHAGLGRAAAWKELDRDLERLVAIGTRLPAGPVEGTGSALAGRGRSRREPVPRVEDACLRLAALAPDGTARPALP